MSHVTTRLQSRVQPQHSDIAARLVNAAYDHYSTAVTAEVKPGLSLVVIARSFVPATIYYRETSRVTAASLKVDTIITL